MRLLPVLMTVLAWTSAASAQDRAQPADPAPVAVSASAQLPTPSAAIAAPAAANSAQPAAPARKARLTWEQRFAQANVTHDGRLTLEQAKAGYVTVARHFADIDVAKKGFVTEDDIRAWHKAKRAARRGQSGSQPGNRAPGQSADASGSLQPQQAFQRFSPTAMQINTSADRTVPRTEATPAPAPVPETAADSQALTR